MTNQKKTIIAWSILCAGLIFGGCSSGPSAMETEFMQAIRENNTEKVRTMLAETPKLANAKDEQSIALHYAAGEGQKKIVALLIANGADIDAKSKTYRGWTALHFAVDSNNRDMVEFLVAKGADVNAKGKRGITPICCYPHSQVGEFDWDIVRFLIDHGARINWKSKCGRILLRDAAGWAPEEIVRLLLDKGAIVNTKADYGYSALHAAAGRSDKDLKVVELLVARGAQIDAEWNGATPLHRAAWSGNAQAAEFLISKGANVNAKDQRGRTPLAWAIEKGYDDVAELLRKHGAVE